MYTLAHIALAQLPAEGLPKALRLFNQTALEVSWASKATWRLKRETTSRLRVHGNDSPQGFGVGRCVLGTGAIAAGASEERVKLWYALGEELGLAFQMQDDLLDAFGDEQVGKQLGGDILADKKTFLRLYTQENGAGAPKGPCEMGWATARPRRKLRPFAQR